MNLRKQLLTAFLLVAVLPLLAVSLYLFGTNITLAHDLYEQNLLNSSEMQADLVGEALTRMMVRTGNFTAAPSVQAACINGGQVDAATDAALSNEILKFTDEALDSISIFALLAADGSILYSSGSNSDTKSLEALAPELTWTDTQRLVEIDLQNQEWGLAILSPVVADGVRVGGFLALYRPDFFLKTISSHKQMEGSNSFLYCMQHHTVVVSKRSQWTAGPLDTLEERVLSAGQGALTLSIGGEPLLCYYRDIPKTDWVLVNSIPKSQISSLLWGYGLASCIVLLLSIAAIYLLSHRQSKRILTPLEQLLEMVEQFFTSGAAQFSPCVVDPKTEIGYLATKFTGMADEIATTQRSLQESTYLYQTLLKATYELRVTVALQEQRVMASLPEFERRLAQFPGTTLEQLFALLAAQPTTEDREKTLLREILFGQRTDPTGLELCCDLKGNGRPRWHRMLSVPIVENGQSQRVVLHFEDINEKKLEEFRLIHNSQVDPLCGLLNKTAFLPRCLPSQERQDAMFFIDLDKFKQVNDIFGHALGDEVLVNTANAIRTQFRSSDVLGRYGGDEFVVFAPNMNREQAELRAKRLIEALSFELGGGEAPALHVTASVGICLSSGDISPETALVIADEAMYHAKQSGKACYHIAK